MFNKSNSHGNRGQSTIESSLHGMANMLAIVTAVLVAPQIYDYTAEPVYSYMLRAYSDSTLATLGMYAWIFTSTATVYFLSRAIFVLCLMLLAQRLLTFIF